jgi:hypothetical protein
MVLTYHHIKSWCHPPTASSPSHEGLVYTTSSKCTSHKKFLRPSYNQNVHHKHHQFIIDTITIMHTTSSTEALVTVLGQEGPDLEDHVRLTHADEVGALCLVVY